MLAVRESRDGAVAGGRLAKPSSEVLSVGEEREEVGLIVHALCLV